MLFFDIDISSLICEYGIDYKQVNTTPEIVMRVSGLPFEAIRAIARECGVNIKNERSRCIDENLLSLLADAHIRRLKSYFNKSNRHLSELSGAEFSTFIDFCETFKKHQSDLSSLTWDDIDVESIREEFINEVHESTPGYFGNRDRKAKGQTAIIPISLSPYTDISCQSFKKRKLIAQALIHYRRIRAILTNGSFKANGDTVIRWVTKSFRFHIFSSSGNDYHLYMLHCAD